MFVVEKHVTPNLICHVLDISAKLKEEKPVRTIIDWNGIDINIRNKTSV